MNRYFEETILNAEPIDLIRLLYQRAISRVQDAREDLRERRIPERVAAINQAYAVLLELVSALRSEAAPELSTGLRNLYCYIQQRLLDANMQQADAPLAEALQLLVTLEAGWAGVAASLSARAEAANCFPTSFSNSAGEPLREAERLALHA